MDNARVRSFIDRFQARRAFFQLALERYGFYRARVAAVLERERVPNDLAYLPLIESGYRPAAVSRGGAVGLWQLRVETARRYGLRMDSYVDERRDPIRSTRVAARYLRILHAAFGNWHLALAAYHIGLSRVARGMARRESNLRGPVTAWESLPRDGLDYVAAFLAASQVARAPKRHGFEGVEQTSSMRYDLVRVRPSLSFRAIAAAAGASAAEIANLNPELLQRTTPPDGRCYLLRVPKGGERHFGLPPDQRAREPVPAVSRIHLRSLSTNASAQTRISRFSSYRARLNR